MLGASYKQDVSDIRSSPSIQLSKYFKKQKANIYFHDPLTNKIDSKKYNISNILPKFELFDIVLFCVKHNRYKKIKFNNLSKKPKYFDLNCVLDNKQINFMIKNRFKLEDFRWENKAKYLNYRRSWLHWFCSCEEFIKREKKQCNYY